MITRIFIGLFLLCSCTAHSQKEKSQVQVDSSIRHDTLANGLSYFIKPVDEPGAKIRMRLYAKVGHSDQEIGEVNFSHAIEHLGFRETINFPHGLSYNPDILKKIGMEARDLDGSTGAFTTDYSFNAPPGNIRAIQTGLDWFRDIATGMIISEKTVEREKGVLLQEYGLDDPLQDPDKVAEDLYANLFPCEERGGGTNHIESTKNIDFIKLARFYKKWYRPDRLVVVVIGPIDQVNDLEKRIKETFEDIPRLEEPIVENKCKEFYTSPHFSVVRYKSRADKKAEENAQIFFFFRDPIDNPEFATGTGIHRIIFNELASSILSARLRSLSEKYGSFYRSTAISSHRHLKTNSLEVVISAEKKKEEEAITDVMRLLNQTRRYGVTKNEFSVAIQNYFNNRNTFLGQGSLYWEHEIKNIVERNERLPDNKAQELRFWLKNLEVKEFNKYLQDLLSKVPEDIGLLLPEGYHTRMESEKQMRKLLKVSFAEAVEPYAPKEIPSALLIRKEVNQLELKDYIELKSDISGTYKYVLHNGVKLVLKPTDSAGEKIYIKGFSEKGAKCYPKNDFYSTVYAPGIIKNSGAGKFNKFELQKFLNSTSTLATGIFPYVHSQESGLSSSVSPEELDSLLQLIYLYISRPPKNSLAFHDWKKGMKAYALDNGDQKILSNLTDALLDPVLEPPFGKYTVESINEVDFERAHQIFKEIFQDAEDFTFIVTGSFKTHEILPLLNQYLGNLPSETNSNSCSQHRNDSPELEKGPLFRKVNSSKKGGSFQYSLSFLQPYKQHLTWRERLTLEALGAVTNEMVKGLRAKGFSLYYFGVGDEYDFPLKRSEINFRFTLVPEEYKEIRNHTFKIVNDIKTGDLPEGVFENAITSVMGLYNKDRLQHPKKVLDAIYHHERYEVPLVDPKGIEELIRSLKIEDLIELANEIFKEENRYEFLMK